MRINAAWTAVARLAAGTVVLAGLAAPGATAATSVGTPPPHRAIQVGGFPTGITLNRSTHTIYVGNGTAGTLSLIDGKTCNAHDARSCGRRRTAVTAGTDPIGIAVDESTNTVYVVNFSGTVAVVNGRQCDATHTSGCQAALATVRVGVYPQFLAVDDRTHTVYVANSGSNTVSVIDGRKCNAASTAHCGRLRASIPVGPQPFTLAVNDVTGSIYVTDLGAHTISVIDGKSCNATNVSGCRRRPVTVNVGETPGGIAVDRRTNTIYVTGESTNDVSVIDGRTCNARATSGCRQKPVHALAGAGARGIAVNEVTHTVYVANTAADTVSVIDGASCNATVHSGCTRRAAVARVGLSPRRVVVDEVTNTIYVTNAGADSVTILDGRTCNGRVHTGAADQISCISFAFATNVSLTTRSSSLGLN
jgi:DNA-binding beta-propeller fold protein YncE